MKARLTRLLFICSLALWSIQSFSQETNRKKIIGTWAFSKMEFLRSNTDSLDILNYAKGMIVIFSEDSITVKNRFDSTFMRTSTYTISPDGSTLTHNRESAIIAKLTDEELALNIPGEGVIEHLKRVH